MRYSTITTSLNKNIGSGNLRYKQFDTGQKLGVKVMLNGRTFSLDGYTAKAYVKLPTKQLEKRDCVIENNVIILELDNYLLSEVGTVVFEIKIHKENINTTTFRMKYFVEESFNSDDAVDNQPSWNILQVFVDSTLVRENGDLYFYTYEGNTECPFELEENGDLYYIDE